MSCFETSLLNIFKWAFGKLCNVSGKIFLKHSILDSLYIGNPSILDSLYTGLPLYRVSGYVRLSKINNDIDNNSILARKTSKANYCDGFIILNQM